MSVMGNHKKNMFREENNFLLKRKKNEMTTLLPFLWFVFFPVFLLSVFFFFAVQNFLFTMHR